MLSRAIYVILVIIIVCTVTNAHSSPEIHTGVFGAWSFDNRDEVYKIIKDNKFDLAVVNSGDIDKIGKIGLKAIVMFDLKKATADDESRLSNFISTLRLTINKYKDSNHVFAWYLVDEPELQQINPATIKLVTDIVRSIDKKHPLFTVMNNPDKWKPYLPYFDIIAEDKYLDKSTDSPEMIRVRLQKLKSDIEETGLNSSVWAVLGALDLKRKDGTSNYHRATAKQFEDMVNICVKEKVGGILVYTLGFKNNSQFRDWNLINDDPQLWNIVRRTPDLVRNLPTK